MGKPRKLKPFGFAHDEWINVPKLDKIIGYLDDLREREESRPLRFNTPREARYDKMCKIIAELNEIDGASR